jgi:NAD(P)-dependent dehydrogenase (short-subunit alcohol dehydrogenase family)
VAIDIQDPNELIGHVWDRYKTVDVPFSNDTYPAIHVPIDEANIQDLYATIDIDNPIGTNFIKEIVPAGRLGEPEEIGELIKNLANMERSFHTGTIVKFAGGWPVAPNRPI